MSRMWHKVYSMVNEPSLPNYLPKILMICELWETVKIYILQESVAHLVFRYLQNFQN